MGVSASIEADGSTSHTLLDRVRLRDAAAWRRFVELYGPVVFRWARRASLQPHDAADVVQEVFQAVAAGITRFRLQRPDDTFRGWLRTITLNKVRDQYRARPNYSLGTAPIDELPARIAAEDEADSRAGRAVAELAHRALQLLQTEFEPSTWRAFLRTAVDGCSPADTADELGLSLAAVYKAKSRVLNKLRRELDGLLD
jgi:RNA polymerase sigma-70 factor (ECF subfamily)